jgi:imidazolonepropionase-like amidohydrolase
LPPSRQGPRLITAREVILGDGETLRDAGVVTIEGRIIEVAPVGCFKSHSCAQTESFPDGFLVPGLIDAHVHLCFGYGADLTSQPKNSAEDNLAADVAVRCRRLLAAGVTSVRDLGSFGHVVQQTRDAIVHHEMEGPRIICAGRPVTTADGHLRSFGLLASGAHGMSTIVKTLVADGVDTIKVIATGGAGTPDTALGRAQFSTAELEALVMAAARSRLQVAAHAHGTEGISRAVAAGVHTVEHCSWMDETGKVGPVDQAVLTEMRKRRQVAVIAGPLPPSVVERLTALSPVGDARAEIPAVERLMDIWKNARLGLRHGVTQAIGSDSLFGQFADCHDLAWRAQGLVELAGWSETQVLEALWKGGAAALGLPGILGTITPGAYADLVVLGSSPEVNIRALHDVRAVFRRGFRVL